MADHVIHIHSSKMLPNYVDELNHTHIVYVCHDVFHQMYVYIAYVCPLKIICYYVSIVRMLYVLVRISYVRMCILVA